jgi:hypothetical protein
MASTGRRAQWLVVALIVLAAVALMVGVWAQFFPRGFYRSFPSLGRHWVSVDGPFNEHLVRDVGGLNVALAAVTVVALVYRTAVLVRTAALAWLLYAVPHLVYHANHLDRYDGTDKVLMVGSLAVAALLPVWLFVDADTFTPSGNRGHASSHPPADGRRAR